ncbi:MarR family winged helix-turn-helix transcriptional regulator [Mycoplasma sp. P36-A1]|uniref:MarR family winged helix-turn-helix transcriptional regulator n=1 Tax=Mycoplasma sp. P36-A1 TaxID=3252900 RepID=UPI003C2D7542
MYKREKIEFEIINQLHAFDLGITSFLTKTLEPFNITPQHYYIMEITGSYGQIGQDVIISNMSVNKSNVTKFLNALEDEGIIERKANIIDKRSRLVSLTEKGDAMLNEIQSEVECFYFDVLGVLGEYDKLSLITMLKNLNGTLHKKFPKWLDNATNDTLMFNNSLLIVNF